MVEGRELLVDFIREHPEWSRAVTTDQLFRALFEIRQLRMEQRLAKVLAQSEVRHQQREAALKILRFASPTVSLQAALNETTGAGNESYKSFLIQLDGYIRERDRFFSHKILNGENIYASELDRLPVFNHRTEPTAEVMKRVLASLAGIVMATVGLSCLALRSSRRASVVR